MRNNNFVEDKLLKMVELGNVLIHTRSGFVDQRYKFDFVYPFFAEKTKEVISFLRHSKAITVNVTNNLVKGYHVYYSGYITNDHGQRFEFKEIENKFCINIG